MRGSPATAAAIELATGKSVMAIGRPAVGASRGGGAGAIGTDTRAGQTANTAIQSWVKAHFKSTQVGGTTAYDLTQPTSN